MSEVLRRLFDNLPTFLRTLNMSDNSDTTPTAPHQPSVSDVLEVKAILLEYCVLPLELIDQIIEHAKYWPHTTTKLGGAISVRSGGSHENQMVLRSYPLGFVPSNDERDPGQMLSQYKSSYKGLKPEPWPPARTPPNDATEEVLNLWKAKSSPRDLHPCRKIVFTIRSHDQGWGGDHADKGSYKGSFTWFDYGLEKLSVCKESELSSPTTYANTKLLEAWELAPFPQFRLIGDLHDAARDHTVSSPPLVCSLRTIIPATIPIPNDVEEPKKKNETEQDDPRAERPSTPKNGYAFQQELNPSENVLQKNRVATRTTTEHVIVWTSDDDLTDPESLDALALEEYGRGRTTGSGEFVRNMEFGDTVTVWAKARFAGWANTVEDVTIDVYWAV